MKHRRQLVALIAGAVLTLAIGFGSAANLAIGAESATAPLPPCPTPPATPGVPPLPIPCQKPKAPKAPRTTSSDVCVRLDADRSASLRASDIVNYRIVVRNNDRLEAAPMSITLPYAPALQELVDISFTSTHAWVSALDSGQVKARVELLGPGASITITVRLRIDSAATVGSDLVNRALINQDGRMQATPALSNRLALTVGRPIDGEPAALELASETTSSGSEVHARHDGFASNEFVSLWYDSPDGKTSAVGQVRADAQGHIDAHESSGSSHAGQRLVAYGQCSQAVAVATLPARAK